jgi:N-acetylmuramoyl-L-alanine amidase
MNKMRMKSVSCLVAFLLSFGTIFANQFTVTIDAGHGGKDPGALGSFAREKNINLGVALKLGKLIEKKFSDVKVVYTRKTDVFIPLEERAEIANNAHSNLFICIHTNSSPSPQASGAETYTLGLAKTQANMNVARRENAVILLEDNYKERYQGFNPNSTDSYIMFEYMQDKYIDRSVQFASDIQSQFATKADRSDRGVRQAGFWVLHRTSMPAVLVEVGYISNKSEEQFLDSSDGQQRLAESLLAAFTKFKHDHDRRSGKNSPTVVRHDEEKDDTVTVAPVINEPKSDTLKRSDEPKPAEKPHKPESKPATATVVPAKKDDKPAIAKSRADVSKPVFKVQFFISSTPVKENSAKFKGIQNAESYQEGGIYKYTTGASSDYREIVNLFLKVKKTFPDAFVIAFVNGEKVVLKDAVDQWKKTK